MVCRNKWVDVVFVDGDDYDDIADMNIQDMAEYLAHFWDNGTETDLARTRTGKPWGSSDRTHDVVVGGVSYVLAINTALGYASLNRRPL